MLVLYILLILTELDYYCVKKIEIEELTNRNYVKFNQRDFNEVEELLKKFKLSFEKELTPSLYVFKYEGKYLTLADIEEIKKASDGKIHTIAVIKKRHIDRVDPDKPTTTITPGYSTDPDITPGNDLPCYGMGIKEAWEAGYNGSGVVVAVCDIGVDINITDIKPNINKELSHNFVNNNSDVQQVHYHYNYVETLDKTDHGNRCAGLIAAKKENAMCTTGIAYGSKIAVLKIANINELKWEDISDDFLLDALVWRHNEIDVYSNSWQYSNAFVGLDEYQIDTLSFGTQCGRNAKGSIFVFPAESVAEGFSNSRYTISVSSFDPYGGKPEFVQPCACTMTSTYGEGINFGVSYMKTTSRLGCIGHFKGTSASVAMASGIIALALEANNNLTWRDVQHLIVAASDYIGHSETQNFKQNAAGHFFHSVFGFGLLNANYLVTKAINWTRVGPERSVTARSTECIPFAVWRNYVQIECHNTACCVGKIEHVIATISYKTPDETHLNIALKSPSKTVSILMKDRQSEVNKPTERINIQFLSVNFWNENPAGEWEVVLRQYEFYNENENTFVILSFELNITGTSEPKSSFCSTPHDVYDCSQRTKPTTLPDTTDSTSPSPSEEHKSNNTGTIIGIIGCVLFVLVCIVVCYRTQNSLRDRLLQIWDVCLVNYNRIN